MQEEGPQFTSTTRPLRLSRFLRPGDTESPDETVPLRRLLFWIVVWLGLVLGIVLYFKYARHLVPMLA